MKRQEVTSWSWGSWGGCVLDRLMTYPSDVCEGPHAGVISVLAEVGRG